MVAGINSALNTARDALMANLAAISVTGSNISNVNTEGYTRLRAVFTPSSVHGTGGSDAGQISVEMSEAQRIYDKYLDAQIILQENNIGYTDTRKNVLDRIETILNESSGTGISETLGEFWDSWAALSSNPNGLVERQALLDTSQNLVSTISQQAKSLEAARQDINYDVNTTVSELNEYITQIADLNGRIYTSEFAGGSASDLRDQRNIALRKLSEGIKVNFYEDNTGQVNVFLPNGSPLVEGTNTWQLDVQVNPTNTNFYDVILKDTTTVINSSITGGTLHGLLELRDTTVPGYIDSLDSLTTRLVDTVNTQHAAGYDADGNVGGAFFTIDGVASPYIKIESPLVSGENAYTGTATSSGVYTGDSAKNYLVKMVTAATYQISTDEGSTWTATPQPIAATIDLIDPGPPPVDEGANLNLTAIGTLAAGDQFVVKVHSPARDLLVNSAVYADSSKIAASSTINQDGGNASLVSQIGADKTVMDGMATMGEYYSSFIGKVGQDVSNASSNSTHQTALLSQMDNQREQISGVSLDEEMLNLTKYQAAYGAAARLSSVLNEMMETLMNFGK